MGLMMRHQRVQMKPVAVRAAFWVRESFSAGRAKSETPARTRAHCVKNQKLVSLLLRDCGGHQMMGRGQKHTFITGAQKCTVFRPTGLSHMRWNQLCCCCWAPAPLPPPLLCHRRDHSWRRYTDRKGVARAKAWRVVAAAAEAWKAGRDAARAKLAADAVVGGMFLLFSGGGGSSVLGAKRSFGEEG